MVAIKPAVLPDSKPDRLSRVHQGGVKKNSKPAKPRVGNAVIDLTTLENTPGPQELCEHVKVEDDDVPPDEVEDSGYIILGNAGEINEKLVGTCDDYAYAVETTVDYANERTSVEDSGSFRQELENNGRVVIKVPYAPAENFSIYAAKLAKKPENISRTSGQRGWAKSRHGQSESQEVYLVMLDCTNPEFGDDTECFAVCADLEEANRQARTCLQTKCGAGNDWTEYIEEVEEDGYVRVEASGFQDEDFVVRIVKKKVEKSRTVSR